MTAIGQNPLGAWRRHLLREKVVCVYTRVYTWNFGGRRGGYEMVVEEALKVILSLGNGDH